MLKAPPFHPQPSRSMLMLGLAAILGTVVILVGAARGIPDSRDAAAGDETGMASIAEQPQAGAGARAAPGPAATPASRDPHTSVANDGNVVSIRPAPRPAQIPSAAGNSSLTIASPSKCTTGPATALPPGPEKP